METNRKRSPSRPSETSRFIPDVSRRGFTLLEVLIAIVVLSVGLLSAALLLSQSMLTATRSKYMSAASILASEKLEDLSRWPAGDPHVTTNGGSAGSLTADIMTSIAGTNINFFDNISFSMDSGTFSETVSSLDADGNSVYTTIVHSADGTVTTTNSATPPARTNFKRRWLIEQDTPVVGVSRVTVRVEFLDQTIRPPVTYEIATVRP